MSQRAFTLVELLIAMAIVAVLAALIIPTINLVRGKARVTVTGQRAQAIITALQAYGTEQSPATALMAALPLGGVPRFASLDTIYAVIEKGGGTGAGRRWPPYVLKGAGNTGAAGPVTETMYNNPSSVDYNRYRDTRTLFGQIQDAQPAASGAVATTWYEATWPSSWPLSNWNDDAVVTGSTAYRAPVLRYPWGRPGLRSDALLVDTTQGAVSLGEVQSGDLGTGITPVGFFNKTQVTELGNTVTFESWNTNFYTSYSNTNVWAAYTDQAVVDLYMYSGSRPNRVQANSLVPAYNRDRIGFYPCTMLSSTALALTAYMTRSDGTAVTLEGSKPIPFDLGQMSPLRTLELLQAAGLVTDAVAWRSDRRTSAPWNDAWGSPLVVSYAIFQPERYRNSSDPADQNQRGLLLDRCQERYGYNRSLYIAVGAVGATVRSADAGLTLPNPWPDRNVPWDAAKDAEVMRWLWRQARECGDAEEWTETWQEKRPWEGVRARTTGGHMGILYAPTELR
jgi:prepilin-type N-terminal cleavage/methylation domain-containing protein